MATGRLISGINANGDEVAVKVAEDGSLVVAGGSGGGGDTSTAFVVKQYFSDTTSVTENFDSDMRGFTIINDGESALTFTIGTITITVNSKETFTELFAPFRQVSITATGRFRAYVFG